MRDIFRRLRAKWYKWTERDIRLPVVSTIPMERIGTAYGGWIIPARWLHPAAVCYLAGAGEDISFDLGIAARYGCAVHIFDPTPRAIEHVQQTREHLRRGEQMACATNQGGFYPPFPPETAERLHLHPCGIWTEDTMLHFYAPQNAAHVSHSLVNLQKSTHYFEAPVKRLATAMRELGHTRLDLLKLDIEGAEYQVIRSLIDDGISADVLCIEFDETAANHLDRHYLRRIEAALSALIEKGYVIAAKEPDCRNYTLVHERVRG